MKSVLKATIFVASLAFCSYASAWGLSWESVSSWGKDSVEPFRYNVEASGNNLRVYEWVTPSKPYQKCVFVASEHNTQLECNVVQESEIEFPEEQ